MNTSAIYLSAYDHRRLRELLGAVEDRVQRRALHAELDKAVIISPHVRVPTYVVTLDTHVTLQDQATGEITDVVLAIPQDAAFTSSGEVSVLDPLGMALLGCMHGDVIAVHADGVSRELKVVRVLQSPVAKAAATLAAW